LLNASNSCFTPTDIPFWRRDERSIHLPDAQLKGTESMSRLVAWQIGGNAVWFFWPFGEIK
ncbi:MAG TPA: hypothetical protein VK638_06470, partial [Edaphobacter sp.]|nr:hypothetical protein [Edaphobacter sp.]